MPSRVDGHTCARLSLALTLIGACGLSAPAHATENGLLTYPVGVNTVLNGLIPEPGQTRFFNYTQYYDANKFAGADGKGVVPGFHVKAFVEAPRIIHTWSALAGPFTMSSGLIVPLVHVSLSAAGASGSKNAFGDIILEPLLLGYANEAHTLFVYAAPFDVGLPTGSYAKDRLANTGSNYYAFLPSLNATWFAAPGWELSVTGLVQVSTRNKDTDYQSGKVAVLDYHVGYSVAKDWQIGLQGYFLKQFSDDKVGGVAIANGFRSRAIGFGPQVRYDWAPGAGIALKYQREFDVQNRPRGNRFWVQFSLPL